MSTKRAHGAVYCRAGGRVAGVSVANRAGHLPVHDRTALGISLLELLSVITLIGILAAILLPALARSRESANRTSCLANLSQLGVAFHMYAQESGGELPWSGGKGNADGLRDLYFNYVGDLQTFVCPSDVSHSDEWEGEGEEPPPLTTGLEGMRSLRTSYDYLGAYTHAPLIVPELPAPIPKTAIMWDMFGGLSDEARKDAASGPIAAGRNNINHVSGGGNVLWLDGTVTFMLRDEWASPNLPYRPAGVEHENPDLARFEVPPEEETDYSSGRRGRLGRTASPFQPDKQYIGG